MVTKWEGSTEEHFMQCFYRPGPGDLTKHLQQVRNMVGVSDQMYHMWKLHTMTDTSLRLRFLVCRQVELAISGLFPRAQVLPVGSAVNCSC